MINPTYIFSFFCFAAMTLPMQVQAHGMMCTPRQRGAYLSIDRCESTVDVDLTNSVQDYCPHCLNGGTVSQVKSHLPSTGWTIYDPIKDPENSLSRASLCGDALQNGDHMQNGMFVPDSMPRVETYVSGSHVDFVGQLDTNHNGYFEFFLCNLDACGVTDIDRKCFKEGHCHRLLRVPVDECENSRDNPDMHYECGPIDDVYPGRWYVPCRKTGHVGVHIVGGEKGYMRYALPEGVKCEHCVIQWYWATANSCAPRGLLKFMDEHSNPFGTTCPGDGGAVGTYRTGMSECGGELVPEEFWSCADVRITSSGTGTDTSTQPTSSSTTPTSTPIPAPSSSSEPSPSSSTSPLPSSSPSKSPVSVPVDEANEPEGTGGSDQSGNIGSSGSGTCKETGTECKELTTCCELNSICAYRKDEDKFLCSTLGDVILEFRDL